MTATKLQESNFTWNSSFYKWHFIIAVSVMYSWISVLVLSWWLLNFRLLSTTWCNRILVGNQIHKWRVQIWCFIDYVLIILSSMKEAKSLWNNGFILHAHVQIFSSQLLSINRKVSGFFVIAVYFGWLGENESFTGFQLLHLSQTHFVQITVKWVFH
jgi:hypothetical protein